MRRRRLCGTHRERCELEGRGPGARLAANPKGSICRAASPSGGCGVRTKGGAWARRWERLVVEVEGKLRKHVDHFTINVVCIEPELAMRRWFHCLPFLGSYNTAEPFLQFLTVNDHNEGGIAPTEI